MSKVEVFDPPMCCSTGICGPSVDPELVNFASSLKQIAVDDVLVTRHNLSQEPGFFVENEVIRSLLNTAGETILPIVMVDGEVRSKGRYPSEAELRNWTSGGQSTQISFRGARALGALGAAIASNCTSCIEANLQQARDEAISEGLIGVAIDGAKAVMDVTRGATFEFLESALTSGSAKNETVGCCDPAPMAKSSGDLKLASSCDCGTAGAPTGDEPVSGEASICSSTDTQVSLSEAGNCCG